MAGLSIAQKVPEPAGHSLKMRLLILAVKRPGSIRPPPVRSAPQPTSLRPSLRVIARFPTSERPGARSAQAFGQFREHPTRMEIQPPNFFSRPWPFFFTSKRKTPPVSAKCAKAWRRQAIELVRYFQSFREMKARKNRLKGRRRRQFVPLLRYDPHISQKSTGKL